MIPCDYLSWMQNIVSLVVWLWDRFIFSARNQIMSSQEVYRQHGILFEIPDGWEVSEQASEGHDTTITVSDGVAFWALTLMWERPEVEHVLREAKSAFEEEYDEMDIEPAAEKISRRDAVGFDIDFVCLELINSVQLRSFRTGRFTAFLMAQTMDQERDYYDPIFNNLTTSLDVDQDGDILIG